MYFLDLLFLSTLSFESLDLVDYFLSYVVFKFEEEMYFCSIHELYDVLVKIDDGFVLFMLC